MTKAENLNEFFDNMFTTHFNEAREAESYDFRKLRQEHIDEMLESNLTYNQQRFIEEILFELNLTADSDARMYYRQGIKDGVWILKCLGLIE